MPVGDERECRGNIERLAYAHNSPKRIELVKGSGIAHEERDQGPDKQAGHNQPFLAELVGYYPGKGAHEAVDPEKNSHQGTEGLSPAQFGYVHLHALLHRGKHLAVHIVEQCHYPQEGNDGPGIPFLCFHIMI